MVVNYLILFAFGFSVSVNIWAYLIIRSLTKSSFIYLLALNNSQTVADIRVSSHTTRQFGILIQFNSIGFFFYCFHFRYLYTFYEHHSSYFGQMEVSHLKFKELYILYFVHRRLWHFENRSLTSFLLRGFREPKKNNKINAYVTCVCYRAYVRAKSKKILNF